MSMWLNIWECFNILNQEGRLSRKEDIARKTALLFLPQRATGVLSLSTHADFSRFTIKIRGRVQDGETLDEEKYLWGIEDE